jgi:hypothetical protein
VCGISADDGSDYRARSILLSDATLDMVRVGFDAAVASIRSSGVHILMEMQLHTRGSVLLAAAAVVVVDVVLGNRFFRFPTEKTYACTLLYLAEPCSLRLNVSQCYWFHASLSNLVVHAPPHRRI